MKCQILSRFCGYLGAATVAVAALGYTGAAQAASDWPTGPVNVILHTKPGGGCDIFARTLAKSLKDVIDQQIVVINSPGGGGATQMAKIRPAKPDGLTLGVATLTHLTAMQTNLKGIFAPNEFTWIANVQEEAMLLFVQSGSDIKNLDDLVARARKKPGSVSVGGFGSIGSMQNIGLSMLENAAGVKFKWVAFNATPDIMSAVLGGHVVVGIANPWSAQPFFEADRIAGLGVLRKDRLEFLPDLPTFNEQGYDVDPSWVQIRSIFGPAGIPFETQQKIADAIRKATKAKDYQDYVKTSGISDSVIGPKEFSEFIKRADKIAETQLKASGIVK